MPERVHTFVIQHNDLLLNQHNRKFRLDLFVLEQQGIEISRSQVRKLILDGAITVNGQVAKPGYWIKAFDEITVTLSEPRPLSLVAEAIPLDILYEDDQLLVINKSAGMVVHPAPGHDRGTLVHALLHHCRNLSGIGYES